MMKYGFTIFKVKIKGKSNNKTGKKNSNGSNTGSFGFKEWITPTNFTDEYQNIVENGWNFKSSTKAQTTEGDLKITENNLKKKKKKSKEEKKTKIIIAIMTGDFAMQNVLLRMGFKVVSEKGFRIKKCSQSILRCHACFQTTSDMTKQFCPKCGNPTLLRTSISILADGTVQLHLKSDFQYKLRGTIVKIFIKQNFIEASFPSTLSKN